MPAFLELCRSAPYHSPMRKRIRQSLAIVLVLALMVSGLQAVGAARPGSGSDMDGVLMHTNTQNVDHQGGDCAPQDCCASGICQMSSHCLSILALPSTTGYFLSHRKPLPLVPTLTPILVSTLIFTIYRPPWA